MTIHFLLFTIKVSKRKKYSPVPGYRPTVQEKWLDRKASQYM
ncbi:hypothetical protein [Halobacillus litoralis]|nr:hypothetical protein [Halobacillus litoralis]